MLKLVCTLLLFFFIIGFRQKYQEDIPVYFPGYGVILYEIPKFGDTIKYKLSGKENFDFVFFGKKGKCYCQRFINKKLYEKGYYENSLDTLKRYVSSRASDEQNSAFRVQRYFQPLKNGEWTVYKGKEIIKENYIMGIKQ